jgi:HNH endonuclease
MPRNRTSLLNMDLPKGVYRSKTGHLIYSSPKELRGKSVHRKVIEDLIAATPYSIRLLLPWPYEVHHADYNKENNDPSNLLVVTESLHSCMTSDGFRRSGRFTRKFNPHWKPAPEWVLIDDDAEGVPF